MNSSSDQAPAHRTVITLSRRSVLRADFSRRKRMSLCRINLKTTRLAAINARNRGWNSRSEHLIERWGCIGAEVLRILVVRHYYAPYLPHLAWKVRTHVALGVTRLLSIFRLTEKPEWAMVGLLRHHHRCQHILGYSVKASLLSEARLSSISPLRTPLYQKWKPLSRVFSFSSTALLQPFLYVVENPVTASPHYHILVSQVYYCPRNC
jgi:hypothetical protein